MHLENLLKKFPHISLATRENDVEILEFFDQFSLKNKEEQVHYHRAPHFFGLINARSQNDLTFIMREHNKTSGKLMGVAVVNLRPGLIAGKLTTVGYLGDLRVSLNRSLIREWRNCFKEFIEKSPELEETAGCRFYQTALMDDNAASRATLASNKIQGVRYLQLMDYDMVNVIGKYPCLSFKKPMNLKPATANDKVKLLEFLNEHSRDIQFAPEWQQELNHRLSHWPGFSLKNFLLQKDENQKIKGCVYYYNPKKLKTMSLSHIPKEIKALKIITTPLPFFKQLPLPKENQPLEVVYLSPAITSQSSLNERITESALDYLFDHYPELNMIALTDWKRKEISELSLKGYICHRTPMALYSVSPSLKQEKSESTELEVNRPPFFDMVMV